MRTEVCACVPLDFHIAAEFGQCGERPAVVGLCRVRVLTAAQLSCALSVHLFRFQLIIFGLFSVPQI